MVMGSFQVVRTGKTTQINETNQTCLNKLNLCISISLLSCDILTEVYKRGDTFFMTFSKGELIKYQPPV